MSDAISRRRFLGSMTTAAAGVSVAKILNSSRSFAAPQAAFLGEFSYADVSLTSELHEHQFRQTQAVLMELSEDSLLKPLRAMAGQPAPGAELGGWYLYNPDYDFRNDDAGFAPGATFGQWVSSLARGYAITGDLAKREKVFRLNRLYAQTISGDFYEKNRFPAYCYDKLVCGLIDSHSLAGDPDAFSILKHTTDTALPHLPGKAIERGVSWRPGKDESWTWDESYTISENLFLAYRHGAGDRYRALALQYLDDAYYDPLARNESDLAGRHAYSYVNSLCSAAQAYLTTGSEKHLRATQNGFAMVAAQSFATGGWGPDESLRAPGSPDVAASLTSSHNSFETPCGSYAHFKLTRYLLRITRNPRYGDSMERVMYNTILGAKPLDRDGRTFYYSDYNFAGRKVYSGHRWPCCSGTHPQIAADYRISTYFRDRNAVFVNLYIPSTLKWSESGTPVFLRQCGSYPFDAFIEFEVTTARPTDFALNLRIPAWASGAALSVNEKRMSNLLEPGTFAPLRRVWRNGDRVQLELPLKTRLEPLDKDHLDLVALMSGPLVLFAIQPASASTPPSAKRSQLLAAEKVAHDRWQAESAAGTLTFLPFTAITDETYTTYLKAT